MHSDRPLMNLTMTCLDDPENYQNVSNFTYLCNGDYDNLKEHLSLTRFSVQRIVIPLVVIFGIFGNLMSIAVLTRRWMRSSTNYYLTALAIYDTLYLIFAATMSLNDYRSVREAEWYLRYKLPLGQPLIDTFSNTAVWLTLTFTIERWLCVCHPMRGRIWCTPKRAKYIIIIVCFSAALITFPEFFCFEFQSSNSTNKVLITDFANTTTYQFGYVYTSQILFTFLPLLLLLIFNTLLIKAVYRAAKKRTSMVQCQGRARKNTSSTSSSASIKHDKNQREQQKVTITLISVVVVFLLCQGPQAIANMYIQYLQHNGKIPKKTGYSLSITGNILNLLVMINASVNFVLYSTFNTKFRHTVRRISIRTYNKMQRQSRRSKDPNSRLDTLFPYRTNVSPSTTMFTKISPVCTQENLHLTAKQDTERNGCNTWNTPLQSLPKNLSETLLKDSTAKVDAYGIQGSTVSLTVGQDKADTVDYV